MRKLILIAVLLSACSYSEEKADITLHVAGIPADADHLLVVLTPSDTSVTGRNCPAEAGAAANATCYRPSFQPNALNPPALDLAFVQPSATGTVKIDVTAEDRNFNQLATGTTTLTLPAPPPAQITLH
jgi:hypothetical protein